ncbi:MAG: hypothetical protein KJO07_11330, partial [Deltaproteobacteria bacterium]|nr:hypothetical protein [Deltaproteobacteria bacterium]
MFRMLLSLAAALAVLGLGCGGDDVVGLRLVRVPTLDPACGDLGSASSVRVRALGEFPAGDQAAVVVSADGGEVAIESFSPRLQAVAVEVLGPDGTDLLVGRSAAFDFSDVEDGQELPVFLAAPDGACEVEGMSRARVGPRLVPLGDGALVIGGVDDDGPVATVERFRPAAGDFEILGDDHFGTGSGGFIGASLTAVGNRAIAVGGPVTAWQAWELDGTSAGPQFLPEARAFHAAVAIDSNRVLLAGGCSQVVTGSQSCAPGSALRTTSVLDIDSGEIERGPRLLSDRIGGTAYVDVDGTVILVGGTDLDGSAIASGERLELGADEGVAIANLSGASSGQMLSGSVVVGYGQGAAPS